MGEPISTSREVLTRACRNKGLGPADEGRVQSLTTQLLAKLDAYEVILSKQKYLAGGVSSSLSLGSHWMLMLGCRRSRLQTSST